MKLIIGLGNPGKKYQKSRHNVGFMVLDELLRRLTPVKKTVWKMESKFNSQIYQLSSEILLVKPQTLMNASGWAVEKILRYYDIKILGDLWVVHDDLDLPLGKIKIAKNRGSAGHHGVTSIIEKLKTANFVRLRLGIGHPAKEGKWEVGGGKLVNKNVMHREVERYVLAGLGGKEAVEAKKMVKKAAEAIETALKEGLEKVMGQFK